MRPALFALTLFVGLGCGGTASVEGTGGGATTTGSGDVTTSTGSGGCSGSAPSCADACGSDYFPAQASCVDGDWVCPEGTVDPADCPSGTCWGPPLSCEVCGDAGWECAPTESCAGTCGGLVCAECTGAPGTIIVGACQCGCDPNAQYTCSLAPGCCNDDLDCGDAVYVPCVNHVCKEMATGGCWTDVECPRGTTCVGATVCPCGAACDEPDTPGTCQ